MSKRANGEGSIYKYRDRWACSVSLGYDECGKRVRRVIYGKTQKEVKDKLTAINNDIAKGEYIKPNELTVSTWFDIWLSQYCTHVKPKTLASYNGITKKHIKPKLGRLPLQKVKPHEVQRVINELHTNPKTVRNIFGVLNKGLNKAVELNYIKRNPAEFVTIPKVPKPEIRVFTDEELEILFNEFKGHALYNFYKIALLTGLRCSEMIGLTWDCYNPEEGYLRVYRQLQRVNGRYIFLTPKSGKPRNVTLPKMAMDIINSLNDGKSDFIFHDYFGKHLSYSYPGNYFRKVIKKLDIPWGTLHDLRHTYATNAIRAGDNIKSVQTNLGHATPAFTIERYASVTSDMIKESQEKLQSQFSRLNI